MTTAAWLACGALLAGLAWFFRAGRYPGGPGTALAAGLCGGFLGGATVILSAGRDGAVPALSIAAAVIGAVIMLDLAELSSGPHLEAPDHHDGHVELAKKEGQ